MKARPQVGVVMMDTAPAAERVVRDTLAEFGVERVEFCRKGFPPPEVPLLVLGDRPVVAATNDQWATARGLRGLWVRAAAVEHRVYVARDPEELRHVGEDDVALRSAFMAEWRADLRRLADQVLRRATPRAIKMSVYRTPGEAAPLLRRLAAYPHPWAFDIESYDAQVVPSRRDVSTDPCHEDFRVRGVALAWGSAAGVWLEFIAGHPGGPVVEASSDEWREVLDPAFGSDADKVAFNGGFDEEGLTYNGWVSEVRNRRGDGMLDMVALSDGRHASLRLERAVVDYLGLPQYWNGADKGRIREMALADVARSAVEDACATLALHRDLEGRLRRGEYFEWPTLVRPLDEEPDLPEPDYGGEDF